MRFDQLTMPGRSPGTDIAVFRERAGNSISKMPKEAARRKDSDSFLVPVQKRGFCSRDSGEETLDCRALFEKEEDYDQANEFLGPPY